MTLFQLIRSDYVRHRKYGANFFVIVFFTQGFWATFQYRIAHYIFKKIKIKLLRKIIFIPIHIWQKTIEILTGISLPAAATIGHSFYIGHFGGIIFNSETVIGNHCNISQGVTIGVSGQDEKRGVPLIGNNVYIGANSVVAGKIIIKDNVLIGACSLMITNAEENEVFVGVPAVMVSDKSSKGYI